MSLRRRDFLALGAAYAAAACARTIPAGRTRPAGAGVGHELGASGGPGRAATPKRILVLGGTGFLGPHLVRAARTRGHALTLFNRGKTAPGLFPDVETILGDRLTDTDRLRGRDWDAVVDTWVMLPKSVRMTCPPTSAQRLCPSDLSSYSAGVIPPRELCGRRRL